MVEQWRDVVGYEGWYQVSDAGQVKRVAPGPSTYPGRFLKPSKHASKGGSHYLWAWLHKQGKRKGFSIHRLVAAAFIGLCPPGHQINHRNGDPLDNRIENLEWVTPSENVLHSYRELSRKAASQVGENNSCAKLTERDVLEIRRLYATRNYRQYELAEYFRVTQSMISQIVNCHSWKHIT